QARRINDVAAGIAESELRRLCERGSVEPAFGAALLARQIRIPQQVWPLRGARADVRPVDSVNDGEWRTGLQAGDTAELPILQKGPQEAIRCSWDGKLIHEARYKTMTMVVTR